jgi:hypothetical protein
MGYSAPFEMPAPSDEEIRKQLEESERSLAQSRANNRMVAAIIFAVVWAVCFFLFIKLKPHDLLGAVVVAGFIAGGVTIWWLSVT